MFKKVLAPLVVAGALLTASTQANASEVNFEELAKKAKNNSIDINTKPLHKGSYDYNFTRDGINYHFYSDGVHFGYKWHDTKLVSPHQDHLTPSQQPIVNKTENKFTKNNTKINKVKQNYTKTKQNQIIKPTVRLSNGNTAGSVGQKVAQEMAARTGVSASTWEHIIARESNGDPNAHNPSGADGLLQTKGWGDTSTIQGQINAAERAFDIQGLSAWGF